MKKAILIVIVIGMLGWAIYDYLQPKKIDNQTMTINGVEGTVITSPPPDGKEIEFEEGVGTEQGDIAPDFELQTLDGDTVRLSDYRGKPVLLNFWATWCAPCRAEMPDMQKLYEEKNIEVLAVNLTSTESSIENVDEFVKELKLTFPILMDEENDIAALVYKVPGYPTSYMIDSNGHIQYIARGAMNYDLMTQELAKMN